MELDKRPSHQGQAAARCLSAPKVRKAPQRRPAHKATTTEVRPFGAESGHGNAAVSGRDAD
jgi:hypothetical protein